MALPKPDREAHLARLRGPQYQAEATGSARLVLLVIAYGAAVIARSSAAVVRVLTWRSFVSSLKASSIEFESETL